MNIYRISQAENGSYDTFDSAIVVAASEEDAKNTTPDGKPFTTRYGTWASKPENVTVELVGTTDIFPAGTILCASFNAG